MSSAHLKADLAKITQAADTLNILAGQFDELTRVTADGSAAGNAALASALSDFANGWSDKRNEFTGEMKGLAADAGNAVKAYEATDNQLAAALSPKGAAVKPGA
jgi:hypothetical protein